MPLVEVNWNPTTRQLRQFGLISLVLLPLLAWMWSRSVPATGILLSVGIVLAAMGWVAPSLLRWVYVGPTILTAPIALVVTEVALLVIFFGAIFPIGLILRMTGRDLLQMKRDEQTTSYWTARKPPRDVKSYYQQF